jgi:predicted metal-dependent hydrolase
VEQGVVLFNSGRFWHCHEALEKVWLKESGDTKTALQGIILIAAAFHHQKRKNRKGMLSTMRRGLERLTKKDEVYGIDVGSLRATMLEVLGKLENDSESWLQITPPQLKRVEP